MISVLEEKQGERERRVGLRTYILRISVYVVNR